MIKFRGHTYRVTAGEQFTWPDSDVSLECRCADDRGVGYTDEDTWSEDDRIYAEDFEETCAAQERMEELVSGSGLEAHVDVWRNDDRSTQHQDCYVRFNLRDVEHINSLLVQAGLAGDILDVYDKAVYDAWAERIKQRFYWNVELSG